MSLTKGRDGKMNDEMMKRGREERGIKPSRC